MSPVDSILTALAGELGKKIMGKIFELAKGKFKFAFEIKSFSIGQGWNDENFSHSLIALVEFTNLSDTPCTISKFSLAAGEKKFDNLYIAKAERKMVSGTILDIYTGSKLMCPFQVDFDYSEPLWRPFLQKNESALGILAFKLDKDTNGSNLGIEAQIAGHGISVYQELL
jgi:hypothetical protein